MKNSVIIIAAVALNGVIGKNGTLPWNIPSDTEYFWRTVDGNTMVVGRRTYEDLPSNRIAGQDIIVLTGIPPAQSNGVRYAKTFEEVLKMERKRGRLYVAGGTRVYQDAMPYAHKMLITRVIATPDGDTLFPEMDRDWCYEETPSPQRLVDKNDQYPTSLEKWVRI